MPLASPPGSVSPAATLACLTETDRLQLFDRDRQRAELAQLVLSDSFRAGLLYGEAGVGKSSLLRAGLLPDMHEQGVIALMCSSPQQPILSFAQAIADRTGLPSMGSETAIGYLSRIVADTSQIYLFVLDDVEVAMEEDDSIIASLAELFTRIASRANGRARFLFSCASNRVHRFAALEQRTGSLFPPSSRYQLTGLTQDQGAHLLEQLLRKRGADHPSECAQILSESLAQGGPILPCDLRIADLALQQLDQSDPEQLSAMGGFPELQRRWIAAAAKATGNERCGLRILAELSTVPPEGSASLKWLAKRASIQVAFAEYAVSLLHTRGLIEVLRPEPSDAPSYRLSHEVLIGRVRLQAAPARRAAKTAVEALGSKAAQHKSLSPMEYLAIRREGLIAGTPEEQEVLARTKVRAKLALAMVAALPLLLLALAYVSMSGRYYLDLSDGPGPRTQIIRAGRPSLSWLNWLPASPAFGEVVADTGLSELMVSEPEWRAAQTHETQGDMNSRAYARQSRKALRPRLGHFWNYAEEGDEESLRGLQSSIATPEDWTFVLQTLSTTARASAEEEALLLAALQDVSVTVQSAALQMATATARRKPGAYSQFLTNALLASDAESRRLALLAVNKLPNDVANTLIEAALERTTDAALRQELQLSSTSTATSTVTSAIALLQSQEATANSHQGARAALQQAFRSAPAATSLEAMALASHEEAQVKDRVLALTLILEYAQAKPSPELRALVEPLLQNGQEAVRAAALPLYAYLAPSDALVMLTRSLATLDEAPASEQVATAHALGQVAHAAPEQRAQVQSALEALLKTPKRGLRAAAARAYGYVGRSSQEALIKMIKVEFIDVAQNAAFGLVNSVKVGASPINAIGGIRDMWKRKGKLRRIAAQAYAEMAKTAPKESYFYLSASLRASDDAMLHPIGMQGMCNALRAGYEQVGKDLARASDSTQTELRQIAMDCVVDVPNLANVSLLVASAMAKDPVPSIRLQSARVLAQLATEEAHREVIAPALLDLLNDRQRDVRILALGALQALGSQAPSDAIGSLPKVFENAEESEKLLILRTAAAVGASELSQRAIQDTNARVRIAALDLAMATEFELSTILRTALTDSDPSVRLAALERLTLESSLAQSERSQLLALAIADPVAAIAARAMMSDAQLGDVSRVLERLRNDLESRSERVRTQAATASLGLVQQDAKMGIALLSPKLTDRSHDVRTALLRPLATAFANTRTPEQLATMLRSSESNASQRLVATGAFLLQAEAKDKEAAVQATLESLAKSGPAFAAQSATLALRLLSNSSDGLDFLLLLVP